MNVTCNEDYYKYMPTFRPEAGPCGKTYDDAERYTICPHKEIPPRVTPELLDAEIARQKADGSFG